MPSKNVKPFYIQPYPIYYALLGSQGNAITSARGSHDDTSLPLLLLLRAYSLRLQQPWGSGFKKY